MFKSLLFTSLFVFLLPLPSKAKDMIRCIEGDWCCGPILQNICDNPVCVAFSDSGLFGNTEFQGESFQENCEDAGLVFCPFVGQDGGCCGGLHFKVG